MFMLAASVIVALCLRNTCVAGSVSFDSVASDMGVNPAATDECVLRSWYMPVLAQSLLTDAHEGEEKTNFQTNIDEIPTSNIDDQMTASSCHSYYKLFVSWRQKKRGGKCSRQFDGLGVSNRSVSYLSHGRDHWLSPVSLSANRSYTACYYAAIWQHVCPQNISRHDVRDDNDTRRVLVTQRAVDEAEIPVAKIPAAELRSTANQDIGMHVDHAITGSVCLSVPAALAVAKTFSTSTTTNVTGKSSTTEKNDIKAAKTAARKSEATKKLKVVTTSENTSLHDVRDNNDARRLLVKENVVDEAEIPVAKIPAAALRSTANQDIGVQDHAITGSVCLSVPAALAVAKTFRISNTTNMAQKSSTTAKNDIKAAKTTARKSEATKKPKIVTTSGNISPTPVNKTTSTKPTDKYLAKSNVSVSYQTKERIDFASSSKLNKSKKLTVYIKLFTNTSIIEQCDVASDPKPSTLETYSYNLPSGASVKEIGLPQPDETMITDDIESLASDSTMRVEPINDGAKDQHQTAQSPANDRECAQKQATLVKDDAESCRRSRVDVDDRYELQLRSVEMKLLRLDNQLLQSTVDMKTTAELENYVMRLERELMTLNQSVVQLKTENEQLRQRHLEAAAAAKDDVAMTSVGAVAQLTDTVNNQSNELIALRDRCAHLERDYRLLFDRLLNQSLMMNEMLLHVYTLGREQTKHTLQLMELKQHGTDGGKTPAVSCYQRPSTDHAEMFPVPPIYKTHNRDNPADCYDHFERGQRDDAVLTVRPAQRHSNVDVSLFCDMAHHGWTVIQRRLDGSVDFYRSWNDYKLGFGNISGEYWLGNEMIHLLTNQDDYSLRVSLTDWNDVTLEVDYDHFRITDELDGYRIYVAGYREPAAAAGDSLLKHSGCRFSTFDVDNDLVDGEFEHGSCARRFAGAWWYYRCYMSNLNGRYYVAGVVPDRQFDGIAWKSWTGSQYSLKRVEMKIRPARVRLD